jgi:hypothetical protein
MTDEANLIAEHYQKTFEVTLATWDNRNQTFLILLATVGAATLLTFNAPQAQPLLVDFVSKILSIEDATRKAELRTSFPYGLLQSIMLMAVMYLMLVLYHRTTFINRSYRYLEALEKEIRASLQLSPESVAFTREGVFYWKKRPVLSKAVGAAYVGTLGILLIAFLGMRIASDFLIGNWWFMAADVFLSLPTLLFFGAYAQSSIYVKWIAHLVERGDSA